MTALDALHSVQYVTVEGKRFAVIDADDWEVLIEWLEDLEDDQVVRQALEQLDAADGKPDRAGWLSWEDVKDEL